MGLCFPLPIDETIQQDIMNRVNFGVIVYDTNSYKILYHNLYVYTLLQYSATDDDIHTIFQIPVSLLDKFNTTSIKTKNKYQDIKHFVNIDYSNSLGYISLSLI